MIHCLLLLCVLSALLIRNRGKQIQILPFLFLFFVAAFRYMYGNDYDSYYSWYRFIQAGGASPYDEVLFTLLNQIVPHFYVLIALHSFLFILVIYLLMSRNLPQSWLFMGLMIFSINPYLYLMNLSAIRQCLAMLTFIVAVPFAMKKKLLRYVLCIFIGTLFHKSAIVLLPVYFLANTEQVKKRYVLLITLCLIMALFVFDINRLVGQIIIQFDDANYLSHMQSGQGNSIRATLLSSLYFVYVLGNLRKMEGKALVYSKLYLLGTILSVLAFRLSMLTRIQMYFDIFSVVSLPLIMKVNLDHGPVVIHSKNILVTLWELISKYVLPALIMLIYLLRYYSFFSNPLWQRFTEYRTIFSAL